MFVRDDIILRGNRSGVKEAPVYLVCEFKSPEMAENYSLTPILTNSAFTTCALMYCNHVNVFTRIDDSNREKALTPNIITSSI